MVKQPLKHPPSSLLTDDEDVSPAQTVTIPHLGPKPMARDVLRAAMEVALQVGTVQGLAAAAEYATKLAPYESPKLNAIAHVEPPQAPRQVLDVGLLDADERAALRELLTKASGEGEVEEPERQALPAPERRGLVTKAED